MTGPIGFVGLVVPHVARIVLGHDHRFVLPFCALAGALLVTGADSLLRYALSRPDIPVGAAMAFIRAPFFIYLARYRIGGVR